MKSRETQTRTRVSHAKNKKSRFLGVTYHKQRQKWMAYAGDVYIGLFPDEVEAARAFDKAVVKRDGEDAVTNATLGRYENSGQVHDNGDGTAYILLRDGSEKAIIDSEDVPRVSEYSWSVINGWCIGYDSETRRQFRLHRFLTGQLDTKNKVLQVNGDRLDCRKSNLILA